MAKKALKEALSVKAKDAFVEGGASADTTSKPPMETEVKREADKAINRQITKPKKVIPAKVTFYWDPATEGDMEELRLKLRRKYGKRLTRSQIAEGLVKSALKNKKVVETLI